MVWDSKVVDSDGAPRVMYHSSIAVFDKFKRKLSDLGIHFGTAEQAMDRFQLKMDNDPYGPDLRAVRHNTIPVYLSIKNPLRLTDVGQFNAQNLPLAMKRAGFEPRDIEDALKSRRFSPTGQLAGLRDLIESKGYDGVVYKNTGETGGAEPYRKTKTSALAALDKRQKELGIGDADSRELPEYKAVVEAERAYKAYRNQNAEDSFIAFRPNQIKSAIANRGTFDPRDANIVHQGEPENRNARVTFAGDKKVVDYFKTANASSGIHELWHLWWHQLVKDAEGRALPSG